MEETIANKEETNMVGMIGKKRKWLTDGYVCLFCDLKEKTPDL